MLCQSAAEKKLRRSRKRTKPSERYLKKSRAYLKRRDFFRSTRLSQASTKMTFGFSKRMAPSSTTVDRTTCLKSISMDLGSAILSPVGGGCCRTDADRTVRTVSRRDFGHP